MIRRINLSDSLVFIIKVIIKKKTYFVKNIPLNVSCTLPCIQKIEPGQEVILNIQKVDEGDAKHERKGSLIFLNADHE